MNWQLEVNLLEFTLLFDWGRSPMTLFRGDPYTGNTGTAGR